MDGATSLEQEAAAALAAAVTKTGARGFASLTELLAAKAERVAEWNRFLSA